MRNFRKAALAGATAVAVAFGSTAVATAQTAEDTTAAENTDVAPSRPVKDKDGKETTPPEGTKFEKGEALRLGNPNVKPRAKA